MKRALISVTNKTGVAEFAAALVALGWEVVSTGGTAKLLKEAGVPVILVEEVTGFPEMMDGRLKTLHPKIFGGILADRTKPEHMQACEEHGIVPIDLVCVNLYDFAGNPSIEQIDIGGPSLLRAAAKNCASVIVVSNPSQYNEVLASLGGPRGVPPLDREELAEEVFMETRQYDRAIAAWMSDHVFLPDGTGETFKAAVAGPHS
jgi:phosphoribosylaminoimidazolecarboxamide formyltransferase/IMP cyclohydrolase